MEAANMTTLVTGAGGLIGGRMVAELRRQGQSVRALVRREEQAAPLRQLGVEVFVGDVRDREVVDSAARGVDVVHQCAAATGPKWTKQEVYDVNLGGVRNVLEAMRSNGKGRMVYLSSINVLGIRHFSDASEDMPTRRENEPHSDVKIDAEQLCLDYYRRHGVDVTILRPGLVYGPGERHVPKILDKIKRGKFAFIGSRDHVIPMVHLDDQIEAMHLAATKPGASGRIYHVTDGGRTTIGQLADYLAELSGSPEPPKVLPYIVPRAVCFAFCALRKLHLVKGPGPITRVGLRFLACSRHVSIGRAREELGYRPQIGFREGIAATVRWIEEHHDENGISARRAA
jgi:2-alkyl-3-oxoalkanoate reductase